MKKSILISLFALLGVFSAQAYDFEVDGIYYNIISGTDNQVEVTHGSSSLEPTGSDYTGSVVIPSTVEYNGTTYAVTSIGEWAFGDCRGLTSVTIPESVTSIGDNAFYCCRGLTSVTIPESVTTIGNVAFYGTSISSPVYNSKMFVYLPRNYRGEYVIPSGIRSIAGGAFYECRGLNSVTIPESVTTIGEYAFYSAGLVSVTSLAQTPLRLIIDEYEDENCFEGFTYVLATLYVPQGCKSAYESAKGWCLFAKIEEAGTAYTVTILSNDASMGGVTKGGEYASGETVPLVAIAYQGYEFVRWDDGNTNNPRLLKVEGDVTLTAIFAKNGTEPDNPDKPDNPTANEAFEADNFGVFVHNRTIYLSEYRGLVQVYNMAGQCVYNGHATAIPVQLGGVYVVVSNGKRIKVSVK